MKDSLVTKNRNTRPASGTGKLYSVGCLPILIGWFLFDLIGKTIIYGIASLFGKPMPTLAMVIKWTAYSIFIPLGVIFIAILIWILYVFISERISNLFQKGKKDKEDKKDKKTPTETSSTETGS